MSQCSNLCYVYNDNYNNNCLVCYSIQIFARSSQWRYWNHDCFVHTQLHTRLTEFLLEMERSCSRLFENSIATSFLFVYNVQPFSVRLRWALIICLFHTNTNVVVGLLITIPIYICVSVAFVLSFYLRNNIFLNLLCIKCIKYRKIWDLDYALITTHLTMKRNS